MDPSRPSRASLRTLHVILRRAVRGGGRLHEERVVRVSRRVHLRLDQRVEVPKPALHEVVRRHLREPQLQKDLAELLSNLEQRVHVPAVRLRARARDQVVRLEPRPSRPVMSSSPSSDPPAPSCARARTPRPSEIRTSFHASCFTSLRFLIERVELLRVDGRDVAALDCGEAPLAHVLHASAFAPPSASRPSPCASHFLCIACLNPTSETALSTFA